MAELSELFAGASGAEDDGFLGLPMATDLDELEADVALLGAPIATPYRAMGTYAAGSPAAIRAGLDDWRGAGHHHDFDLGGPVLGDGAARVVDCGDLPGDAEDNEGNRRRITGAVRSILNAGAVPVVLGGDDSVPIPLFAAFEGGGPFTVVQIDAHIDWRDEVGGERYGLSSTMRRSSEMPWIERIVQVGARGLGSARPSDCDDARDWGAHIIDARAVHRNGIGPILELIPAGSQVLFTLDCDGLDPSIMPAVIGPAPGGLSYWQLLELLHGIASKAHLAAFDIVEFMPARDPHGLAALTAARILCNALGLLARAKQ